MYLFIYYTRFWFCLFWACWVPGGFLAGRDIFSFCVGLRCVECRSGTSYLSASREWVAGLYRFFFSGALLWWVLYNFECWPGVGGGAVQVFFLGLCCGGYGTIEVVGGCGPFSLPSSVCCLLCRQAVVSGTAPFPL